MPRFTGSSRTDWRPCWKAPEGAIWITGRDPRKGSPAGAGTQAWLAWPLHRALVTDEAFAPPDSARPFSVHTGWIESNWPVPAPPGAGSPMHRNLLLPRSRKPTARRPPPRYGTAPAWRPPSAPLIGSRLREHPHAGDQRGGADGPQAAAGGWTPSSGAGSG